MVADGRRAQPGLTEVSSLDVASLLLGLIFCFRVEALRSRPVSSLLEAGLVCVPWSFLLLLPFILAVQKPRILFTVPWPPWATFGCFAAILSVYFLSFQNPSVALSSWDYRSGLRFAMAERFLAAGLGMAVIAFVWGRRIPSSRQILLLAIPILFLLQQIRGAAHHPLDWWR